MKLKPIVTLLIGTCIIMFTASIINTYRQTNRAYNLVDPNCVEIRYYTMSHKIHFIMNEENRTEIRTEINGATFSSLKDQLKENWIFTLQHADSYWRGILTQSPTQD